MNIPVVSVIILTLNSEPYIERCLRSLERQTFPDFEALIVDAGSTDRTQSITEKFDPRFKWLSLQNSDMGAARNYGMLYSQGEFLCFLDSDDFYLPEKIERQVRELRARPEVDVTYCAAWHFRTGDFDRVGLKKIAAQPVTLKDYLEGRNHNLNTMFMRRRVREAGFTFGEGTRGRYGEEWRMQLSLAQDGVRMEFQPDPQVVVELRPDSHTVWSRQWMMKREAINEIEQVASGMTPQQRAHVDIAHIIDKFRYKLLIALLLDGRFDEAAKVPASFTNPIRARKAQRVLMLSSLLPEAILGRVLRGLWQWHQNRSFDWQNASVELKANFVAVHSSTHN